MLEQPDIFLPTLHSFAMDNVFTGSWGEFRFRAVPTVEKKTPKEVDMEKSFISVRCWHGPFCYEKSQMEDEAVFPMSEEGLARMKQWLTERIPG